MELKICKHGNGYGWCSLHKEYCPQSPCEDEELITYKPVEYGIWKPYKTPIDTRQTGWICTNCSGVNFDLSNGDTDFCPYCGAVMDTDD